MVTSDKRGATIIELLVSVSIFAIALSGIFLLFRKGYQSFHFLQSRQSLQVEMLRVKSILKADFDLSHFRSIGLNEKIGTYRGEDTPRHEISCLILDDWNKSENYAANTNIPIWNRYAYYNTSIRETTLIREVLQKGSTLNVQPITAKGSFSVVNQQLLTKNLVSLEAHVNEDTRDLTVEIELGRLSVRRGVDEKVGEESFQGTFRFTAANTQPKL